LDIFLSVCQDVSEETSADRVSIWFFNTEHSAIECACFYNKENDSYTSGQILHAKDAPAYFNTLEIETYINAPDARNHPATAELTDPYFIENDTYSLLDFIIHDKQQSTGVICCEKIKKIHHWRDNDHYFLRQISTLISHHIKQTGLTMPTSDTAPNIS